MLEKQTETNLESSDEESQNEILTPEDLLSDLSCRGDLSIRWDRGWDRFDNYYDLP